MTEWATKEDVERIDQRLNHDGARLSAIESEIKTNSDMTRKTLNDTEELLEFFRDMKGAFKVLNMVGKLAKPLAAIIALGAAVVGLWSATKSGFMPPPQ